MSGRTNNARKNVKRGQVVMPVEPPRDVLFAMAGDPAILAASDEEYGRFFYAMMRRRLSQRKAR